LKLLQPSFFIASDIKNSKSKSNLIGRVFDVSDLMLTCCSSNLRNEIIVGSADHALYSIDVLKPFKTSKSSADYDDKAHFTKPYKTMYGKTFGHTDWVTRSVDFPLS
jgi:hypothetical protein